MSAQPGTMEVVRPRLLRAVGKDDQPSADELLVRSARGDEAAFGQLYKLLGGLVYGIVLRVLVDPAMAEEVTQEVLVEAWRKAPSFAPERASAKSWIATIAHRRAVDRVRSEEARRRRETADHQATPTTQPDVVADVVTSRSESDRMHAALEQLPAAQREALSLAYFGGRTYRQVAAMLDIPEGTAKTRIRDGLIRLRDILGVPS